MQHMRDERCFYKHNVLNSVVIMTAMASTTMINSKENGSDQ